MQEEMCRQFYDAHALSVAVLRPDYIIDMRLGLISPHLRRAPQLLTLHSGFSLARSLYGRGSPLDAHGR